MDVITITIVDCTISAQGGGVCVDKISFFYHFLTDWFNAVSILLSIQYDQSIQYNVRGGEFLIFTIFILSSANKKKDNNNLNFKKNRTFFP